MKKRRWRKLTEMGRGVRSPEERPCPACGKPIDSAINTDESEPYAEPEAGDLTVCSGCDTALQFTVNGYERLTAVELMLLPKEARDNLERVRAFGRSLRNQASN